MGARCSAKGFYICAGRPIESWDSSSTAVHLQINRVSLMGRMFSNAQTVEKTCLTACNYNIVYILLARALSY